MIAQLRVWRVVMAGALAAGLLGACSFAPKRPDPTPLGPVPPILQVTQVWHADVGPVPATFAAVVVDGGVVVASADGRVTRLDASSGQVRWQSRLPGGISAGVGSDGHFTAVVNRANQLASLGPQGRLLWLYRLPTSVITPPLVARGVIVVQGAD